MCWLSERLSWDGMYRQRAAGSGNPGELLCHVFTVSGFRIMGSVSRLSLAHHLACSYIWHDCGPSCRYTHLSAKVDSIMRASWRLAGHIMGLHFLLLVAPPKFCQLVFSSSTMFLMGTSCCEATCEDASGHHCTWTKGGFSQCFPNPSTIFVLWKWNLSFKQAN